MANYPYSPPFRVYTDQHGEPLNNGYLYFGTANQNPETNPITVYWDLAGTVPAAQPIRTVNGYPARAGSPAIVYAASDASITVRNSKRELVYTSPASTDLQIASAILAQAGGAAVIGITDAGGYYTGTNVEAALQEIGLEFAGGATNVSITDAGGYFAATHAEGALQELGAFNVAAGNITLARLAAEITAKLVPTGTMMPYLSTTAPTGWVRCLGGSIGNALSAGTERANADTETLFTLLWNSWADAQAPVSGGRGGSAAADFAASKRITLPDFRGRVCAGLDIDAYGTGLANRLTAGASGVPGTLNGGVGGVQTYQLQQSELAQHSHAITDPGHTHGYTEPNSGTGHNHTYSDPQHSHAYNSTNTTVNLTAGGANVAAAPTVGAQTGTQTIGITIQNATTGIVIAAQATGISTQVAGSGSAHQNVQPTLIATWLIKL